MIKEIQQPTYETLADPVYNIKSNLDKIFKIWY